LFRDSAKKAGHDQLKVAINSHAFIADTSQQAAADFYPSYSLVMNKIGRERGWSGMSREHYEAMRYKSGSLLVGSAEQVAEKILYEHELFKNDRFLLQFSVGTMPHEKVMHAIELFGTKVAPVVRKELAGKEVLNL
jgi:alkanesulfonate monooxygenase SsuD/methylene tetrahydromethanopterin reductase-like flavin-dependent oxidoreductase (luciferase family)